MISLRSKQSHVLTSIFFGTVVASSSTSSSDSSGTDSIRRLGQTRAIGEFHDAVEDNRSGMAEREQDGGVNGAPTSSWRAISP